jgi:hypothetical protein
MPPFSEDEMNKLELLYAEDFAIDSALRFLCGQPWSVSKDIQSVSSAYGLDPDLMELAVAVLFPSAVVHVATGKSV